MHVPGKDDAEFRWAPRCAIYCILTLLIERHIMLPSSLLAVGAKKVFRIFFLACEVLSCGEAFYGEQACSVWR
jgi:hypothetical protein